MPGIRWIPLCDLWPAHSAGSYPARSSCSKQTIGTDLSYIWHVNMQQGLLLLLLKKRSRWELDVFSHAVLHQDGRLLSSDLRVSGNETFQTFQNEEDLLFADCVSTFTMKNSGISSTFATTSRMASVHTTLTQEQRHSGYKKKKKKCLTRDAEASLLTSCLSRAVCDLPHTVHDDVTWLHAMLRYIKNLVEVFIFLFL